MRIILIILIICAAGYIYKHDGGHEEDFSLPTTHKLKSRIQTVLNDLPDSALKKQMKKWTGTEGESVPVPKKKNKSSLRAQSRVDNSRALCALNKASCRKILDVWYYPKKSCIRYGPGFSSAVAMCEKCKKIGY